LAAVNVHQVQTAGRILVVDDEASVANVCKMALERGGFQVDVCSGGHQAIELCKKLHFDLILLDVMMPDIDGVEVLRRVRGMDHSAKVLLMTGNASESVEARLKEWTDVVVLSKPMMPKEILESVRRQLMT
jgi:two-component system alkaline phosphatase synthesis response regulator PhoP